MKKIVKVIDQIFIILLVFILNKLWFSYRLEDRLAVNMYSIMNTMIFVFIMLMIYKRKKEKNLIKEKKNKELESFKNTLQFLGEKSYYKLMRRIIKAAYPEASWLAYRIALTPDRQLILIFPQAPVDAIAPLKVIKAYIKTKAKQLVILSPLVTPDEKLYIGNLRLIEAEETKALIEKNGIEFEPVEFPPAANLQTKIAFPELIRANIKNIPPLKGVLYASFWVIAAFISEFGFYYILIALIFAGFSIWSFVLNTQSKKIF
ncbi:MAG TPA: hypothetical protein PLZ84_03885 [Clostridia bacterium]|nr:hypothetical protein [Clostridia bacterium]